MKYKLIVVFLILGLLLVACDGTVEEKIDIGGNGGKPEGNVNNSDNNGDNSDISGNGGTGDNTGNDSPVIDIKPKIPTTLTYKDLAGYSVNIGDASALGINTRQSSSGTGSRDISSRAIDTSTNMLLKYTEENWDSTDVSVSMAGIESVVFSKTITQQYSVETIGSTAIVAAKEEAHVESETLPDNNPQENFFEIANPKLHFKYRVAEKDGVIYGEWHYPGGTWVSYRIEDFEKTEGKEYEIEGESEEAFLTFEAEDYFSYSVYKDSQCLLADVCDNDENDLDPTEGIIKLYGYEDGVQYEIWYCKYEETVEISQENINGEVDKLFVGTDFILISYVPKGYSGRFSNMQMATDEAMDCYAYDLTDYSTSSSRASFVISVETGKVYAIPQGKTFSVHNRTVTEKTMGPVRLNIDQNDQLVITSLVRNANVKVIDYFRDIYGKYYVLNESLAGIDDEYDDALFFIWAGDYVPARNGKVLRCEYEGGNAYTSMPQFTSVTYVGEQFSDRVEIEEDVDIRYRPYNGFGEGQHHAGYDMYMCIEDGCLYTVNNADWHYHGRFNLKTKEATGISLDPGLSHENGFIGILDHKTILLGWNQITDDGTFDLYCYDVYEECKNLGENTKEYMNAHRIMTGILFNIDIRQLYKDIFNPWDWEIRVDGFSGTKYYKIIPDSNAAAKYSLVETKNYVATYRQLILQPLAVNTN